MSDWVLATEQSGHTRHYGTEALPVSIGGSAGDECPHFRQVRLGMTGG